MNGKATAKKPFRFNLIDLFFLLIILGAGSVLVWIFVSSDTASAASAPLTDVEYRIELKNVREELKGHVNIGDKVIDASKLYSIGEVVDVKYSQSVYTGVRESDGTLVYSDYTGYINISITVKASADTSSGSYMVDGVYRVSVGSFISFRVPDFTGSGYCVSIKEVAA